MKISFVHYSFRDDGVSRVVTNNIAGIKETYGINCSLIGEHFSENLPRDIEKRHISWDEDPLDSLMNATHNSDAVIIENPTIGKHPKLTEAFKRYAEESGKRVLYRTHDLVDDRPEYHKEFKRVFPLPGSEYPKSDNVRFLTLTSTDKRRLEEKGIDDVHVLSNPIIPEELIPRDSYRFRAKLEEESIIGKDEMMLAYPVRILPRKNIEEAIFMTSLLDDCRLLVSLPHRGEYQQELESFADELGAKCSLGKVASYIGEDHGIADFLGAAEYVMTTSVREGFGFAFIEPWMSGTPVIGRNIPSVTEDFKKNGMLLDHLYDGDVPEDPAERIRLLRRRVRDDVFRQEKRETLEDVMSKSENYVPTNKDIVEKKYDYRSIAKELYGHIN